jgi:hypothetical protein
MAKAETPLGSRRAKAAKEARLIDVDFQSALAACVIWSILPEITGARLSVSIAHDDRHDGAGGITVE